MTARSLSELAGWELADSHNDVRGRSLVDEHGRQYGKISDLLVDTDKNRLGAVRTDAGEIYEIDRLEILDSKVVLHEQAPPGGAPEIPVVFTPPSESRHPEHDRIAHPRDFVRGEELRHAKVQAVDGDIGRVTDVYFDDRLWTVRYLVIDTSRWLFGRRVLISPKALVEVPYGPQSILLNLTRDQIRDSPSWNTDPPISRQYEATLHGYYGWGVATMPTLPVLGAPLVASTPYAAMVPPGVAVDNMRELSEDYDEHLRSMAEVTGYRVQATDGEIAKLEDFAFLAREPRVHALILSIHGNPGEDRVMLPVQHVTGIDWPGSTVKVNASIRAVDRKLERILD